MVRGLEQDDPEARNKPIRRGWYTCRVGPITIEAYYDKDMRSEIWKIDLKRLM